MIHFNERELPVAAYPVNLNQLVTGKAYYQITYDGDDKDMEAPLVLSMVFIGMNIDDDETDTVYFQDALSYDFGIRLSDDPESGTFMLFRCTPDGLGAIFEFDQALDEMMKCSIRRQRGK